MVNLDGRVKKLEEKLGPPCEPLRLTIVTVLPKDQNGEQVPLAGYLAYDGEPREQRTMRVHGETDEQLFARAEAAARQIAEPGWTFILLDAIPGSRRAEAQCGA